MMDTIQIFYRILENFEESKAALVNAARNVCFLVRFHKQSYVLSNGTKIPAVFAFLRDGNRI